MPRKKTSQYISKILRHEPEIIGIELDREGWASVDELIAGVSRTHDLDMQKLEEIVRNDDKSRYEFNADRSKIRALQGHNKKLDVDLTFDEAIPPPVLYHGTAEKSVEAIESTGLLPMDRQYVHLSYSIEKASQVGERHGKLVIYSVDAAKMVEDGYKFYISKNMVWQIKHVPAKYLKKLCDE